MWEKIRRHIQAHRPKQRRYPQSWMEKVVFWLGLAAAVCYPFGCYAVLEYIHFANRSRWWNFLTGHTQTALFLALALAIGYVIVWLVTKRAWAAMLCFFALTVGFSLADYLKYAILGEYLYPWDFLQTGNISELTDFISVSFPWAYILLYVLLFLAILPAWWARISLPAAWFVRLPVALIALLCCFTQVSTAEKAQNLLNENGLYLEDMALQSSNYLSNGFVGAFFVNTVSRSVEKPEGYSQEAIETALAPYAAQEAAEDFCAPDIILVLSESFWDPTTLPGVTFSEDPLANYREIASREGAFSGKFYTTGFGGGTVRPEFEVLTGLSTDYLPGGSIPYQYVQQPLESFASLYRSLGYQTVALHPYSSAFYFRDNAYGYLGFEHLYFEDTLSELPISVTTRGNQVSDDTFVDYLLYYLEQADDPLFLFGISMESHQPYQDKFAETEITVESDVLSEDVLYTLQQYTQCMQDADRALKKLTDAIDQRERDTILIYFGDHLPTLGANYGAYVQTGIIDDVLNVGTEEKMFLQSTPFLIYANFDLGESTMLQEGTENEISSYLLMTAAGQLIGAPQSVYQNFLTAFGEALPVYNVRLAMELTEEEKSWVDIQRMITYDRLVGAHWSDAESILQSVS